MGRAPAASNPEPVHRRITRDALRRPVFAGLWAGPALAKVAGVGPDRADDGASVPPHARYGDAAHRPAHTVLTGLVPPAGDRPVGTERHRGGGAGYGPTPPPASPAPRRTARPR